MPSPKAGTSARSRDAVKQSLFDPHPPTSTVMLEVALGLLDENECGLRDGTDFFNAFGIDRLAKGEGRFAKRIVCVEQRRPDASFPRIAMLGRGPP